MQQPQLTERIIIVGAGPTGTTLALLLARLGIASTIIERRTEPQTHPAASILNTRSMEIFREIGLEREIMADCQDVFSRSNITWVTSLAGRQLGQLSAVQQDLEQQLALSPTHAVHYPQHRLEPKLWQRVRENELIEFRCGSRCVGVSQTDTQVTAVFEDTETGERSLLSGAYLVACDGGESPVRKQSGIEFDGPLLQNMMGVHFEADLAEWVQHRPSILYWVFNPDVLGVLIAHWLPTEWVLFFPYFPPQQSADQFDEQTIREKIVAAVGAANIPGLKLHRTVPWKMTARLAARFRDRRLFLAGDAAHTFPPTGGLGLNTGVQDAHNLAWKFAAVLNHDAAETLLATYESERRPVAAANLEHTKRNYWKMNELTEVVGLKFQHLERLRRIQQSAIVQALPQQLQTWALQRALRFAMHRLARFDSAQENRESLRRTFAERIPDQVAHYRFLGLDLGFRYHQGAVFDHHQRHDGENATLSEQQITDYHSTLCVGGRLPHLPIEYHGQPGSTLDLVPRRGCLVLTTSRYKSAWDEAIRSQHLPPEMLATPNCLAIGPAESADVIDSRELWQQLIGANAGVLVRPDGHVAWLPMTVPTAPRRDFDRFLIAESQPA